MSTQAKNGYVLTRSQQQQAGYQWWWHSFNAQHRDTKANKSFFIQYQILNPGRGGELPVFKNEDVQPAYASVRVGVFGEVATQLTQYYGTQAFQANSTRMQVVIGDNYADDTALFGEIQVEGNHQHPHFSSSIGHVIWNLRVNKRLAYDAKQLNVPFFMKRHQLEMDWHVEGMYTEYSGTIVHNGEVYDVLPATSYGYQDTSFGADFSNPWVNLSCNNFKNPITGLRANLTSLVVGGGRLGLLNRELERKVLIAFSHHGKLYEYNFAKIFAAAKQNVSCVETDETIEWNITATNNDSKIEIHFSCPKAEMLALNLETPHGQTRESVLCGATGIGNVKLYALKEKAYKLIGSFDGDFAQCQYGIHD